MDNSMEQRFVDRLLHALAAMGQYESVPKSTVPVPVPYFSFTGSRGSKLGDLGPYGKQVVQFYTQVKTVTARWFDDDAVSTGVNTTISLK